MNIFDISFTKQSQSMSINLADVREQENVCKNSQGVCKFANLGLENFISCLAICKGIRQVLHSLRGFLNLCCKMSTGSEKNVAKIRNNVPSYCKMFAMHAKLFAQILKCFLRSWVIDLYGTFQYKVAKKVCKNVCETNTVKCLRNAFIYASFHIFPFCKGVPQPLSLDRFLFLLLWIFNRACQMFVRFCKCSQCCKCVCNVCENVRMVLEICS